MKRIALACLVLALAACAEKKEEPWLGYAEGETALVAAPQPGWVTEMPVQRGSVVKRGDLLFVLDDTRERAGREQASANLEAAQASLAQEEANLAYARTALNRQESLARSGAGVPAQRDVALNTYRQAQARIGQLRAQIGQMQAALEGASYGLSQRRILAQTEGRVQDIYFRQGEYAPASVPVVSILPPQNVFVRFFVPETQFSRLRMGQKVRVTCDGCRPVEAEVSFIAAREEFTQPVIFSAGNREKLVFKAEARVKNGLKINPGQPVEVRPL